MATKNNPGEFDCYENAEGDEPMFVLLARDPQAPGLVRQWAHDRELRIAIGEYRELTEDEKRQVDEAMECANAMEAWRKENRP
jgi:hypothetical protein